MGGDSNPRYLSVHTLSRRAQSTALSPIPGKLLLDDDVLVGGASGDHRQDVFGIRHHDVQYIRFVRIEQALDRRAQVFLLQDALARDAEAFAQCDVVGVDALGVARVAEEGVGPVALVFHVLPLHDHAKVLVVQDDGLGRDVFDVGGGQFLDVHQEGAVAVYVDDLPVGLRDFGADGGGVAEAHGTEARGGYEGARMDEVVMLARPHLVLADACGDDGFAFGHLVQEADDVLRLDDGVGVLEGEREAPFPAGDLFIPAGEAAEIAGAGAFVAGFRQQFVEPGEGVFHVAQDGEADDFVLVDLRVVDVDVDDGPVLGEFLDLAGDAVVEADADGQEQVGFVDGVVGVDGAVHAEPFQRKGMVFREAADAHQRGGDGYLGALGEFQQFNRRVARDDAAAAIDHRLFRRADEADEFVQFEIARFPVGAVAAQMHFLREDGLRPRFLDVFRDVDEHRAGPPRLRDVEGLLHDARYLVDVHDEVVVLHDGQGHAEDVGLLEGAFADHGLRHLAGDRHQRDGIHVSVRDAGEEIGRPRAGSGHANAGPPGDAGIAFGGEYASLFVTRQQGADALGAGQGLVDGHAGPAGVREDDFDSFAFEAGDEDFRAEHGFAALGAAVGFRFRGGGLGAGCAHWRIWKHREKRGGGQAKGLRLFPPFIRVGGWVMLGER